MLFEPRNLAVLGLAVGTFSLAAADDVCNGGRARNQGELQAFGACKRIKGDITMEFMADNSLMLPGVQTIDGDLVLKNSKPVHSFNAPNLQQVKGTIMFLNNTELEQMQMENLASVKNLNIEIQPLMKTFLAPITSAQIITIRDTQLESLKNIKLKTAQKLTISSNRYLSVFQMNDLKSIDETLSIEGNSPNLQVELSKLGSVGNVSVIDLGEIRFDNLTNVSGSIGFVQNSAKSIELPELVNVKGSLSIVNNTQLTKLDVPQLKTIGGGFTLANNTVLDNAGTFKNLRNVDGAIDFAGTFSKVSFPALKNVGGAWNMQTTSQDFKCPVKNDHVIVKGSEFTCKSTSAPKSKDKTSGSGLNRSGSDDSDDSDSDDDDNGSNKKNKKKSSANQVIANNPLVAAIGLAVAVFALF